MYNWVENNSSLHLPTHLLRNQKGQNPKEIQMRKFPSLTFFITQTFCLFFCVELKWPSPQLLLLLLFSFSISLRNSSSSYFGTMKLLCGSKLVSFTTYRLPQTAIPAMPRGFYCCHSYLRSPLKKTPDLNQMTRCWPLDWYYYQYLVPFFKAHKKNSSPHLMSRKSKYCTLRL